MNRDELDIDPVGEHRICVHTLLYIDWDNSILQDFAPRKRKFILPNTTRVCTEIFTFHMHKRAKKILKFCEYVKTTPNT